MIYCVFIATTTSKIYTLSLHDALPISTRRDITVFAARDGVASALSLGVLLALPFMTTAIAGPTEGAILADRKSTRLNSSHSSISYAVFCLKKKNRYSA